MSEHDNQTPTYSGNKIPLPIKIVWIVFASWLVFYLVSYSFPDLKVWLSK